ncbi:hypothetical protein DPMN_112093 [Dreissena polymorpha]|uniref:C2H2-type domain-containing protein n=1 Tax=Dreissena polymorpha TaxID=45954 RepID=A0A9D4QQI3_DREPO|nr:hypothetical protein DPMN_112044 [Dreissena polymorpha]KAH3838682.1 hypothetical protein DPMN_112093 [Dreissena polymorpha]
MGESTRHTWVNLAFIVSVYHICYKSVRPKAVLKRHLLTHTHERQYVCEVCNRSFQRKDHLKRHCVTHITSNLDNLM